MVPPAMSHPAGLAFIFNHYWLLSGGLSSVVYIFPFYSLRLGHFKCSPFLYYQTVLSECCFLMGLCVCTGECFPVCKVSRLLSFTRSTSQNSCMDYIPRPNPPAPHDSLNPGSARGFWLTLKKLSNFPGL